MLAGRKSAMSLHSRQSMDRQRRDERHAPSLLLRLGRRADAWYHERVFAYELDGLPRGRRLLNHWLRVLYSMSYDNPKHREMMDMEGLKAWKKGRVSGFGPLGEAVETLHFWAAGAP